MITNDYDWEETNASGNYLYYRVINGEIIGEVSTVGVETKRSWATVYNHPDVKTILGQYINGKFARKAVEDYWRAVEGNFIEMKQ